MKYKNRNFHVMGKKNFIPNLLKPLRCFSKITLHGTEFVRRFEQHILPKGFVKMRHYGILSNKNRSQRISLIFRKMKLPPPPVKVHIPLAIRMFEKYGIDMTLCSVCKRGHLKLACIVFPNSRGSPISASSSVTSMNSKFATL